MTNLDAEISFSPDKGVFRRVFSGGMIARHHGKNLIGSIGFYAVNRPRCVNNVLDLGAFITNFKQFNDPDVIFNNGDLVYWIEKISQNILLMPDNHIDLLYDINHGKIGPFPSKYFLESTPDSDQFISWMKSI